MTFAESVRTPGKRTATDDSEVHPGTRCHPTQGTATGCQGCAPQAHNLLLDDDPQRQIVRAAALEQAAHLGRLDALAFDARRREHQRLGRVESELDESLRPRLLIAFVGCGLALVAADARAQTADQVGEVVYAETMTSSRLLRTG